MGEVVEGAGTKRGMMGYSRQETYGISRAMVHPASLAETLGGGVHGLHILDWVSRHGT
jgi:hypothetical protein